MSGIRDYIISHLTLSITQTFDLPIPARTKVTADLHGLSMRDAITIFKSTVV